MIEIPAYVFALMTSFAMAFGLGLIVWAVMRFRQWHIAQRQSGKKVIPDLGSPSIGSPVWIDKDLYVVDMYHAGRPGGKPPRYVLGMIPREDWGAYLTRGA